VTLTEDEFWSLGRALDAAIRVSTGHWKPEHNISAPESVPGWRRLRAEMEDENDG
jgi:hypothetical protein